jgi:hypothetical protein
MTAPHAPTAALAGEPAVRGPAPAGLPAIEAVDALPNEALAPFIAHAAALQARAAIRLGTEGSTARIDPTLRSRGSDAATADNRMLTAQEVAELLNAKPSWVYRHRRQLGGEKLDGLLRFSARRVQSYVERQRRAAA